MKQEADRDCVAAVAAMATQTTLAQFKAEVAEHPDGGYADLDFLAYCARHGVVVGGMFYEPDTDLVAEAIRCGFLKIRIDQAAYVGVESERFPGKGHALYWDGKTVYDPNPNVPDGRPLTDYKINFWWPLIRSADGAEYLAKRFEGITKMNENAKRELPRYRCHKEVRALKIKDVVHQDGPGDPLDHSAILTFEEPGYEPIQVDAAFLRKHNPQPGGYYVVYAEGYQSFSPAKAFEEGYTRAE